MPVCIYCRATTQRSDGLAHVLPEAISKNDLTLPRGSVCNACNGYLGRLDTAVANHREISVAIQAFGLIGKTGRKRRQLGRMKRVGSHDSFTVRMEATDIESLRMDGPGRVDVVLRKTPGWTEFRFVRGIYHIAFNLVALHRGPSFVLRGEFDPVRKYIRAPKRREVWPVLFSKPSNKANPTLQLTLLETAPGTSVVLQLFHLFFAVDLIGSGNLQGWLTKRSELEATWQLGVSG